MRQRLFRALPILAALLAAASFTPPALAGNQILAQPTLNRNVYEGNFTVKFASIPADCLSACQGKPLVWQTIGSGQFQAKPGSPASIPYLGHGYYQFRLPDGRNATAEVEDIEFKNGILTLSPPLDYTHDELLIVSGDLGIFPALYPKIRVDFYSESGGKIGSLYSGVDYGDANINAKLPGYVEWRVGNGPKAPRGYIIDDWHVGKATVFLPIYLRIPAPIPGDINGDWQLDETDVAFYEFEIQSEGMGWGDPGHYPLGRWWLDLDRNGKPSQGDIDAVRTKIAEKQKSPPTGLHGDLNGDGQVTVSDAVLVLRIAIGLAQ